MQERISLPWEKEAMELLKKECAARHLGIRERLEAPGDVPMEMQKRIYEACEAEKIGMGIIQRIHVRSGKEQRTDPGPDRGRAGI